MSLDKYLYPGCKVRFHSKDWVPIARIINSDPDSNLINIIGNSFWTVIEVNLDGMVKIRLSEFIDVVVGANRDVNSLSHLVTINIDRISQVKGYFSDMS